MILTKKYFNRFQFSIVTVLLLMAVFIGSLQSYLIVKAILKGVKKIIGMDTFSSSRF